MAQLATLYYISKRYMIKAASIAILSLPGNVNRRCRFGQIVSHVCYIAGDLSHGLETQQYFIRGGGFSPEKSNGVTFGGVNAAGLAVLHVRRSVHQKYASSFDIFCALLSGKGRVGCGVDEDEGNNHQKA